MTINLGNSAITGAYLGSNEVSRMYLGDVLVYGELPTTTWERRYYQNGVTVDVTNFEMADGQDYKTSWGHNNITSTLTVHNIDNTPGAPQTVSIVVAGNTVVDHATWTVGTTSEVYPLDSEHNIQWGYPNNYTIASYDT